MDLREELKIGKPIEPGHEVALAMLLTREYISHIMDEQVFKKVEITDQQFNVLRILKGGPKDGYLINEIKARMIFRNADVPRLVNRLTLQGLVKRCENPRDRRGSRIRLTPKGDTFQDMVRPIHARVCESLDGCLTDGEREQFLHLLERLRDHYRGMLAVDAKG